MQLYDVECIIAMMRLLLSTLQLVKIQSVSCRDNKVAVDIVPGPVPSTVPVCEYAYSSGPSIDRDVAIFESKANSIADWAL